jgi:hypothetical protein
MTLSPIDILNKARKAVPAVNFALGVAGVAAAAAFVGAFVGGTKAGIILIGSVFIGMILLFLFSTLITSKDASHKFAGEVLMWAVLIFFIVFLIFTVGAVAVGEPCNWATVLNVPCRVPREPPVSEACNSAPTTMTDAEQKITSFIADQCVLATRIFAFIDDATPHNWGRVTEKADSYHNRVVTLHHLIENEPEFRALPPESYSALIQLLDEKDAIATSEQLKGSSLPPADQYQILRTMAGRLRRLAKTADQKTHTSLQHIADCPASTGNPQSTSEPCRDDASAPPQ